MDKFIVVLKETYRKNIKSASFILMTFFPLIIAILVGFSLFLFGNENPKSQLAVIYSPEISKSERSLINRDLKKTYEMISAKNEKQAQDYLGKEKIKGYLHIERTEPQLKINYYTSTTLSGNDEQTLRMQLKNIKEDLFAHMKKLTSDELDYFQKAPNLTIEKVAFNEKNEMKSEKESRDAIRIIAMVATILMFFIIYMYSSIVAQEITSEKGTRIIEIILSSISGKTHFYGKLTGIFLVSMTQIAIYIGIIGIAFSSFASADVIKNLIKLLPEREVMLPFMGYLLFYFFFGLLVYYGLASLTGSLISRIEDVSKAVMPVTMFGMLGYFIGINLGMSNPQSQLLTVTSYIPFLSSMTMPVRIAYGVVAPIEVLISGGLLLLSSIIFIRFSANLYCTNVLVYSDKGIMDSLKRSLMIGSMEKNLRSQQDAK